MSLKIKSIGRRCELYSGRHTLDTPVLESDELREKVIDETRRIERFKELNKPNPAKDVTKGKYINIKI